MKKFDIEERAERARTAFLSGYNCTQAVIMAYTDLTDIDPEKFAAIVEPLGGGMGRLREVCGAVTGMFIISGSTHWGQSTTDRQVRAEIYSGVQQLAERFRHECGSIVCRELLGLTQKSDPPVPEERTPAYYRRRPCADCIALAARLTGEYLNEYYAKQEAAQQAPDTASEA